MMRSVVGHCVFADLANGRPVLVEQLLYLVLLSPSPAERAGFLL